MGGENKAAVFWETTVAPCAVVVVIMPVHCSEMSCFGHIKYYEKI